MASLSETEMQEWQILREVEAEEAH